ncbi:hypothetical protein [Conexibacter sp. CPCC 206217]|uniref:hypothetical protein n=1 Tax=Conexibacter sp. CPCC 206217 TaxID=3064574 RepID=UPI00271C9C1C|nr:hypothetical protein [Conexibacter sp. CPCC 206217]MDO8213527.1 hypothetical protein [Conexibacter sp. CPCC 206217]
MSGRRRLLEELRAAVDAGAGELARFLAGLDRAELEALVLELGMLDGSLRAARVLSVADAASTPEDFRGAVALAAIGCDDPNLREWGAEWHTSWVAAFTGWLRERLDDPARLLDELVGEGAMPAITARALAAELAAAIERGELAPEPVAEAVRRVRAALGQQAAGEGADGADPEGWDGEARALALVAVIVWADARRGQ